MSAQKLGAQWAKNFCKPSLDEMMTDNELRTHFLGFLQREYAEENFFFLNDCKALEVTNEIDSENLAEAMRIYNTYIKSGSEYEININGKTTKHFRDMFQSDEFSFDEFKNLLSQAKLEISELVNSDILPRFLSSHEWKDDKHDNEEMIEESKKVLELQNENIEAERKFTPLIPPTFAFCLGVQSLAEQFKDFLKKDENSESREKNLLLLRFWEEAQEYSYRNQFEMETLCQSLSLIAKRYFTEDSPTFIEFPSNIVKSIRDLIQNSSRLSDNIETMEASDLSRSPNNLENQNNELDSKELSSEQLSTPRSPSSNDISSTNVSPVKNVSESDSLSEIHSTSPRLTNTEEGNSQSSKTQTNEQDDSFVGQKLKRKPKRILDKNRRVQVGFASHRRISPLSLKSAQSYVFELMHPLYVKYIQSKPQFLNTIPPPSTNAHVIPVRSRSDTISAYDRISRRLFSPLKLTPLSQYGPRIRTETSSDSKVTLVKQKNSFEQYFSQHYKGAHDFVNQYDQFKKFPSEDTALLRKEGQEIFEHYFTQPSSEFFVALPESLRQDLNMRLYVYKQDTKISINMLDKAKAWIISEVIVPCYTRWLSLTKSNPAMLYESNETKPKQKFDNLVITNSTTTLATPPLPMKKAVIVRTITQEDEHSLKNEQPVEEKKNEEISIESEDTESTTERVDENEEKSVVDEKEENKESKEKIAKEAKNEDIETCNDQEEANNKDENEHKNISLPLPLRQWVIGEKNTQPRTETLSVSVSIGMSRARPRRSSITGGIKKFFSLRQVSKQSRSTIFDIPEFKAQPSLSPSTTPRPVIRSKQKGIEFFHFSNMLTNEKARQSFKAYLKTKGCEEDFDLYREILSILDSGKRHGYHSAKLCFRFWPFPSNPVEASLLSFSLTCSVCNACPLCSFPPSIPMHAMALYTAAIAFAREEQDNIEASAKFGKNRHASINYLSSLSSIFSSEATLPVLPYCICKNAQKKENETRKRTISKTKRAHIKKSETDGALLKTSERKERKRKEKRNLKENEKENEKVNENENECEKKPQCETEKRVRHRRRTKIKNIEEEHKDSNETNKPNDSKDTKVLRDSKSSKDLKSPQELRDSKGIRELSVLSQRSKHSQCCDDCPLSAKFYKESHNAIAARELNKCKEVLKKSLEERYTEMLKEQFL